jgi:adenylate cyclase
LVHKVKRKLTTIFCADVVGYSRMMGADEHGTLARLKQCRELMQAFIERHHGRVISWSGDAVLADFSSVVESVQCAVEIQRELKAQNDNVPGNQRMEFRIGINLGDVMIDDHDIFGEGVNISARLQSLAPPGGILISGSVHEQVKNKLAVGFNFMGNQQVKNITEQVPVFVVSHDGSPSMPISGATRVAKSGEKIPQHAAVVARAPALLSLRLIAGVVDVMVACALTFGLATAVSGTIGPAFLIDAPFSWFSSDRTVSTDALPSVEIGGGAERTTTRSIVERSFFGLATQTLRRTIIESKSGGRTTSETREALLDPKTKTEIVRPPLSIAAIVAYLVLMVLTEGLLMRGTSPGKLLMGLRVSGARGEGMDLNRASFRNLAKIVSIGPAFVGFLMALGSKRRQALHDTLAGAYVHDAK